MNKNLFFAALATVALVACSNGNENENLETAVEVQITAGLADSGSRANGTNWDNDEIGVSVTASSDNTVAANLNVKYTTTSTSDVANFVAASNSITLPSTYTESATFAAYAPYNAVTGETFDVDTKSNNGSTTDQKKIDILYASGATASVASPYVVFKGDNAFRHKMTRLVLVIKGALGADKITLGGLKHTGTFNVKSGAISVTGSEDADFTLPSPTSDTQTYNIILMPQDLNSALPLAIKIGNLTYRNGSSILPKLEGGTSYSYDITVKKAGSGSGDGGSGDGGSGDGGSGDGTSEYGLEVSGCTITDWTTVNNGSGEAHL